MRRVTNPPSFPHTYAEQMAKTLPANASCDSPTRRTAPAASSVPTAALPSNAPSSLPMPASLAPVGTASSQAAAAAGSAPVSRGYTGTVQFQSAAGQRLAAGGGHRAGAFSPPPLAPVRG